MLKQLTTAIVLTAALTLPAGAQMRATGYQGTRVAVRPMAETQTQAQGSRQHCTVTTFPKGTATPARPVDVATTGRRYTATPPMRVLGDGTKIYGSIIYADSWISNGANYGLYSFNASTTPGITLEHAMTGGYQANGGGTYADGKYYYNSFVYTPEMGYTFSTFRTLDLATGETTQVTQSFIQGTFDQSQITHDMAYDATTGNIYAIAYIKRAIDDEGIIERFFPAISTIDTYTGFVTPIAETPGFIAIAVNNAGELYGVTKGSESALYRINKTTGETSRIGATGLNPEYVQSMTFDPITDKLYWAETEITGSTGLYEVNVATGKAELITRFPDNEEFTGLFIMAPEVNDKAPAAVSDQKAVFTADALTGKLTFTAPALSHGGSKLSGTLTADITVDGTDFATIDVVPGQKVSIDCTVAEGLHGFSVQLSNEYGDGPRTGASWYAGIDGPAAVTALTVAANSEGLPVVSWTAPAKGRNDGYIDPSRLTYRVERHPEAVVIADGISATSVTDRTRFDVANVYYIVIPYCAGREGAPAQTAPALLGSGSELPVTFSFDTQDDFDLCTVVDANGDYDARYQWGAWMYSPNFRAVAESTTNPCAVYGYSPENAADDWIFMPPYTAESGKKYRVTFRMWTKGDRETLAVTAGPQPTAQAQAVVIPAKDYNHKDEEQTFTAEFTATASGNYYIGFHCTSAKKRFYLFVDDVTIDEVPMSEAPAAVTGLTITPGERGALSATISMTAPAKTASGATLSAIDRIDIYRGNNTTSIHTITGVKSGAAVSWVDTDAIQGFNTYRVVASNSHGAGEKAVATAYIGYDFPVAVTDLTLDDDEGLPVLTWTAPTQGQNGGYINPDELVYRIIRSDNTVMSINAKGTEFRDRSLDGSKHQYFIYYQVEPISAAGIGDWELSNHIVFGDPYKGDFFESFPDAALSTDPWTMYRIKGNNQLWDLISYGTSPGCPPADNDGGMAVFASTYGRVGDEGRLVSPKLSISDMNVPTLAFAFFHNPDEGTIMGDEPFEDRLIPELLLPDGTYVALDSPIYVDDPRYASGWYLYVYDLSEYKDQNYVQLSFHGIAGYANDIHVDYISLENNCEYDLTVTSFTGPASVKVGKTAKYKVGVLNQGMKDAEGYSVQLLRGGDVFLTQTPTAALRSGASATFAFEVPATLADEGKSYRYTAKVVFDKDNIQSNNTTQGFSTRITSPDVPQVRNVAATTTGENSLTLTWGEPDALHVQDSFEDYAAFEYEEIGDYTMVDGDARPTFSFSDIDFPGSSEAKAFQVFNPYTLGIAPMLQEWAAHSGKQVLAAFTPYNESGKGIIANDYLISPRIHGATKLSFWAKTANWEWGLEEFEVMYSVTDASPASFISLTGKVEADKDWMEYSYTLPANATYFAIHYMSNDKYIFYIDDLCYTSLCSLDGEQCSGFRIYRDGVAIADATAADRSKALTDAPQGTHTYAVTALFGKRESEPVATIHLLGEDGINDAAMTAATVTGGTGYIAIEGAEGAVSIANAAGQAFTTTASRVSVPAGVYIVTTGTKVHKVIVK